MDSHDVSDAGVDRGLLKNLFALAWQYRGGVLLALALQVGLLLLNLAGLGLLGLGIDHLRHAVDPAAPGPVWPFGWAPPAGWGAMRILTVVAGSMLGLATVRALLECAAAIQGAHLTQGRIVVGLRARVYDRMQRLSFRFFDANASSSLINRVTGDTQSTRQFIDTILLQGTMALVSLVICAVYMASLHGPLTLACLATTPGLYLLTVRFARRMQPRYRRARDLMDRLVGTLSETIQGIRVIKGFARERETVDRFAQANDTLRDHNFGNFKLSSTYSPMLNFLTQFNLVVLLGYGGWLVIEGRLALGAGLVVFSRLLQQFSNQIGTLANLANSMQECLASARRVFEVLETPAEITNRPGARRLAPGTPCAVCFEHVDFGYQPQDPVLRDVSFTVAAGQCVALLGATGSGKSTLLDLVARFHDPQRGRVLIQDVDARDLELDDLRRNIGIVFQESFLFSHRVRDNIAFGKPDATAAEIERAARIAAAHDFIMALPDGYDTVLGENGQSLSGGQRQRLAIARAVLLNPGILLLDDPTAAIDPETEADILTAMEQARAGRTTFVVAHRLSMLRRADIILVLEDGRIVQTGRHDELVAMAGPYRWMIHSQMADDASRRLLEQSADGGGGA